MHPDKREALVRETLKLCEDQGRPVTQEAVERMMDTKADQEMWQNSRYTVLVFRDEEQEPGCPQMIHLSIRRNDRECPQEERWRDFQRLKNEIIGPDHEAAELYPAEERVTDLANQFHLYVLADPLIRFPFGLRDGMRAGPTEGSPSVQRAFTD